MSWLPAELSPLAAALLIVVSFLTSAISATFGLGGGVAMLVALASLTPPVIALPAHAIVQIGSNAGRAWMMRAHIMPGVLRWFVPGTLLGVLVASHFFTVLPTRWLETLLALFILWSIWAPGFKARAIAEYTYFGVGVVSSFATMFLGATGPMLAAFLSPVRYGRDRTVGTHAACMTLQHTIKVIAFGFLGFVFTEWLPLLSAMILSGLLGTWSGRHLLHRFSEATFRRVFRWVLTALALRLMYQALRS